MLNRKADTVAEKIESNDAEDSNAMEIDSSQATSNVDPILLMKQQDELNQLTFQLDKICRLLSVNTEGLIDREEIFYDIIETFKQLQTTNPAVYRQFISPQKIFTVPIPPLLLKQQELLRKIEQMTYQDFRVRRSMLLQRFDVTIQSFLNRDTAAFAAVTAGAATAAATTSVPKKDSNEQIREAIQSQLQYLQNNPLYFQIEDAIDAPSALLLEHSLKVTNTPADSTSSSASKHRSIVKQVIIGKVPDRGGRVNELRPKRLDDFGHGGGGGKSGTYKNHKAQHQNNSNKGGNSNNNGQKVGGGGQKGGNTSAAAGGEEANNHGRVVTVGKRADEDVANRQHNNFHHQRKKGKKDN